MMTQSSRRQTLEGEMNSYTKEARPKVFLFIAVKHRFPAFCYGPTLEMKRLQWPSNFAKQTVWGLAADRSTDAVPPLRSLCRRSLCTSDWSEASECAPNNVLNVWFLNLTYVAWFNENLTKTTSIHNISSFVGFLRIFEVWIRI